MIKLKNILLEDRLDVMKDRLKLSDDDVLYLKSLNVPNKYIIWLANQYKLNVKQHESNERFKEDAYKYEEALQKFFELSNKNKITDKNINNYKDIFALYDVIEQFEDAKSKREIEKDIKIKGAEKVYEDDKWLVVIPRTEKAACYYGKGTKWCTASTKSDNRFDYYNKFGDLYIFINKKDSNERYQYWSSHSALHIEMVFKDINDKDYDILKFKNDNPSLKKVIDELIQHLNDIFKIDKEIDYKYFNLLTDKNKKIYVLNKLNNNITIEPHEFDYLPKKFQLHTFIKQNNLIYNKNTKKYDCYDYYGEINIPKFLVRNGKLIIKFGQVNKTFKINRVNLETLEGCPYHVGGNFHCEGNKLKTLKGAPAYVSNSVDCSNNELITLENGFIEIHDGFYCVNNKLQTLKGMPAEIGGNITCSYNELKTLEGAPKIVHGRFYCSHNQLKTLKGGPEEVGGYYDCSYNQLESLEGMPEYLNMFNCSNNAVKFTKDDVTKIVKNSYLFHIIT